MGWPWAVFTVHCMPWAVFTVHCMYAMGCIHCALYAMGCIHCALYAMGCIHCALYAMGCIHCALYAMGCIHCALYAMGCIHCALYAMGCIHCALYAMGCIHCALYAMGCIHCALYAMGCIHCALHAMGCIHCALYAMGCIHCALYAMGCIHCALYAMGCTGAVSPSRANLFTFSSSPTEGTHVYTKSSNTSMLVSGMLPLCRISLCDPSKPALSTNPEVLVHQTCCKTESTASPIVPFRLDTMGVGLLDKATPSPLASFAVMMSELEIGPSIQNISLNRQIKCFFNKARTDHTYGD